MSTIIQCHGWQSSGNFQDDIEVRFSLMKLGAHSGRKEILETGWLAQKEMTQRVKRRPQEKG